MKAKIIPSKNVTVEIDGRPISGNFRVESEWEGFMKLVSDSPRETIIVYKPARPQNPWDFILPIFGGGQSPEKTESIETDVVASTVKLTPAQGRPS